MSAHNLRKRFARIVAKLTTHAGHVYDRDRALRARAHSVLGSPCNPLIEDLEETTQLVEKKGRPLQSVPRPSHSFRGVYRVWGIRTGLVFLAASLTRDGLDKRPAVNHLIAQ